ncbi:MAG: hypothetical protein ACXWG4_00760 [Thermoanaerobaculia bacterium]
MMSCDSFRTRFHGGTDDGALLAHLRSCDRCLDFAAHADPDVMFRALGGSEMIPPGGLDAFVGGVMQQVRVRDAETTVGAARPAFWPRRLAMAAALAAAVFGATFVDRTDMRLDTSPVDRAAIRTHTLTTKPVVAAYDSQNATIVEVPTDSDDVKIVMIFDENLPADL